MTFWTDREARWGEPAGSRIMKRISGNIVFDVMLSLVLVGYASTPPARAQAPASATAHREIAESGIGRFAHPGSPRSGQPKHHRGRCQLLREGPLK